jgi:glucokinase
VKVVLGPGSGLGMGILIPDQGGWQVLPSEGGHADLAPGNPLEQEILSLLQAKHGSVCWETVLSGPGLVNLYEVVCQLWGSEPQAATPEWISAQGVAAIEPICHQTLELFFGLLGAAAGNLALTVCAYGGVYIGGGIVPALRDFAATSALRRRFEECCDLAGFTKDIPIYLILDEHPGLIGALACLRSDMRVDIKSDPGSEVEKELQEQSRGA